MYKVKKKVIKMDTCDHIKIKVLIELIPLELKI